MIVEEFYPGFGNYFSVLVEGGSKSATSDVHQAIQTISLAYGVNHTLLLYLDQTNPILFNYFKQVLDKFYWIRFCIYIIKGDLVYLLEVCSFLM